jgi:hypothetical protein
LRRHCAPQDEAFLGVVMSRTPETHPVEGITLTGERLSWMIIHEHCHWSHTMSETLFKFLLSELGTVRVRCMSCKAVVEVPTADLARHLPDPFDCPICHKKLGAAVGTHLHQLAEALAGLRSLSREIELEFVLPVKE